jgi:hypothetical protein
MGPGDDDDADARVGEPAQLGRDTLDGATRLRVRVEQVTRDEDGIDALAKGHVDGSSEGRQLAFALLHREVAHVGVACAQMDV